PRRLLLCCRGDVCKSFTQENLSARAAARGFVQCSGCARAMRLLLPGGGAAWSAADCDFHRRRESCAGATAEKEAGKAVRAGIFGMGKAAWSFPAKPERRFRRC